MNGADLGSAPEIARLQAAVASRYDLKSELGRGGMATVFEAYDKKHHRVVALKLLRPDLGASIGAERFLKEIQIAAQLTHPHILALYDSGEADGLLYYVMPYIDGGSLRQRLLDRGPMSPAEALVIAAPVADALGYAHAMGILHRDIKPENILFSHGHPIVADFGIARAVSSASDTRLTRTGLGIGTPGYMSPEQAAGLSRLDARTDVYSLAVVIYEMLTGETPGGWPTDEAVRSGRFLEAPPAHRTRLTAAGSTVERGLIHGLAIRPDHRTASAAELLEEMRGHVARRRVYRTEEVQAIVNRAAELEAVKPTASGAMTIGGVEALGAEVGIAPELVREAAQAVGVPARRDPPPVPASRPVLRRFIGGPIRILVDRVVEGEVPQEEFPVMVDEIRHMMGNVGRVGQLGRSFSWVMSPTAMRREVEVHVSVRAGRTRITVQENFGQLAGQVFGGIGGGVGGGGIGLVSMIVAGVLHAKEALAFALPAWFVSVFLLARTVFKRTTRRREAEIEALAARLVEVAGEVAEPQS